MKWRWTRGVERKANPLLGECWTFLIYTFLHQQKKQCLEFALTKLREICKYLAGACLLLSAKQSRENQCNEASRLKKNVSEDLSVIYSLWNEEKSLCELNSLHLPPKNHNLFVKLGSKGNWRKRNCGHRLIMHSITHKGGECEKRVGGGAAPLHRLYISQVKCKRYDNIRSR